MLGKLSSFCRGFSHTPLVSSLFKSRKPCSGCQVAPLLPKASQTGRIQNVVSRKFHMIPKNQYDVPVMWFFNPIHMIMKHYELTPIFALIFYDICLWFCFPVYFYFNKTDVDWTHSKRNSIARTMNLRCPTIHKLMVMEPSVYRPWPEMQDVLDAMAKAELQIELLASIEANKGNVGDSKDACGKGKKNGGGKKGGMC